MATETLGSLINERITRIREAQAKLGSAMTSLKRAREQVQQISTAMQAEVEQKYAEFADKGPLLEEITRLQAAIESENPSPVIDGVLEGLTKAAQSTANVVTDIENANRKATADARAQVKSERAEAQAKAKTESTTPETPATAGTAASAD